MDSAIVISNKEISEDVFNEFIEFENWISRSPKHIRGIVNYFSDDMWIKYTNLLGVTQIGLNAEMDSLKYFVCYGDVEIDYVNKFINVTVVTDDDEYYLIKCVVK